MEQFTRKMEILKNDQFDPFVVLTTIQAHLLPRSVPALQAFLPQTTPTN